MPATDNGNVSIITSANGIATISFYHPSQNSLPSYLLQKLAKCINEAGADDAVKIIVLKSGGDRTFCAGASFDELTQIKDKEQGASFFSGFANVINACRKCTKIVVARVQGKAVGGGVGIAAAADYCMATGFAAIKLSELEIGIGPFVISPAVIRKVGLAAFSQLTIRATEFQTAQWAKDKGLYNEVYENTASLDTALDELVSKLAVYNPAALAALKQLLWEGTDDWDMLLTDRAAVSGELVLSAFTQQALHAFLARKK